MSAKAIEAACGAALDATAVRTTTEDGASSTPVSVRPADAVTLKHPQKNKVGTHGLR